MEFKEINVPGGIVQQIDHESPFPDITVDVGNRDHIYSNVNLDVLFEDTFEGIEKTMGYVHTMEKIKLRIMRRLEVYLELDIDGLRKFIINILLKVKKVTVDLLYKELNKKFKVSYRAVTLTLGYIHSKLGILHAVKESYKTPIVYSLKEEYVDIINSALHKNTNLMIYYKCND